MGRPSYREISQAIVGLAERAERQLGPPLVGMVPLQDVGIETYTPGWAALDASRLLLGAQRALALGCTLLKVGDDEHAVEAFTRTWTTRSALSPWELHVRHLQAGSILARLRVVGVSALKEFNDKPVQTAASFLTASGLAIGASFAVVSYVAGNAAEPAAGCSVAYEAPNLDDHQEVFEELLDLPKECTISIKLEGQDGSVFQGHTGVTNP